MFAQSVITSQREIVGTGDGKMAYIQDTGVSYQTTGNCMPYNEFLKRINRATSVPIRTLHQAMREGIGTKPLFSQDMINDQSLARIISNITNWKIENSMQRFKYKQTAYDVKRTRLTDENGKLYEDIVQSYIGNHLDISCAKKFFDQLSEDYPELNVNFRDQLNNQQLRTIIDEVINSSEVKESNNQSK